MTSKDAAMFPIIASCTLLGLYIFFKVRHLISKLIFFDEGLALETLALQEPIYVINSVDNTKFPLVKPVNF